MKLEKLSCALLALATSGPVALASDWTNLGGDAARTGRAPVAGPAVPVEGWSSSGAAIEGASCVVEGARAFHVRRSGTAFLTPMPVVATDVETGAVLWEAEIPYSSASDVATWLLGVRNDRVLATRGTDVQCLDAVTGFPLWNQTVNGLSSGEDAVFAPNGDVFVGTAESVVRLDASNGALVWTAWRSSPGIGAAAPAYFDGAMYTAAAVVGGVRVQKYDATSGALLAEGPAIPVGVVQNSPFVGPDASVYWNVSRADGAGTLYAFSDATSALVTRWTRPTSRGLFARAAIASDGAVLHVTPLRTIEKVDAASGAVIATSSTQLVLETAMWRITVDSGEHVYVTNGGLDLGALTCFSSALAELWTVAAPRVNAAGPTLAAEGALFVAAASPDLRIYRYPTIHAYCFGDGSGTPCPCGGVGAPDGGCPSSIDASGARLDGFGAASVTSDSLTLAGSRMPNGPVLYFQGLALAAGGAGIAFGDGLRCVSSTLIRLGLKANVAGASIYPAPGDTPISIRGEIPASGGQRFYQAWYRNAQDFCTSATFNSTNAVRLTWVP